MARRQDNPPSPIDNEADRALISPDQIRVVTQNNEYVDLNNVTVQDEVILEILKVHPLAYALQATVNVPMLYVQQFWNTSRLETRNDVVTIVGMVDQTEMAVNLEDFRRILHIPTETAEAPFAPLVAGNILFSEVLALGVHQRDVERVNGISQVTQAMLPPLWFTLFNIVNRCLSSKTHGVDKASTNMWHIIHAIAYGRRIDFALQLWQDIITDVDDGPARRRHSSIPWMRFISIMIRDHMDRHIEVRRRSGHPRFQSKQISRMNKRSLKAGQVEMPIPVLVLNTANQEAESVSMYRVALGLEDAPMDPSVPRGPTQGAQPVPPRCRASGTTGQSSRGGASGREVM